MSVNVRLIGNSGDNEVHSAPIYKKIGDARTNATVLTTADFLGAYGRFKTATRTTAGTTQLITAVGGGSTIITDIIISGEKQAGSAAILRFTDGTNSEDIFNASQVDAPPNIAHQFRGRVQGWVDARVDFETTGAGDATVIVCYVKMSEGITYAEWDALR